MNFLSIILLLFPSHPDYCWEPPCGQLDPSKDEVYNVLEDIYNEMLENFTPEVFHMGSDEVLLQCWNTSDHLQNWMLEKGWELTKDGFLKSWDYFQRNALERFDKVSDRKLPIILWLSTLTEEPYADLYIDKDRYIIQIWSEKEDEIVSVLLEKGFNLIISFNNLLYLDCGFPG